MKDANEVVKRFRKIFLPDMLKEAVTYAVDVEGLYNPLELGAFCITIDHGVKWVGKLRDLYLKRVYSDYFMEDGLIEEKQKAIKIFDNEFSKMMDLIVWVLRGLGFKVEYTPVEHLRAPVSSAISVLGLMALDCKVSDPYILGSILER